MDKLKGTKIISHPLPNKIQDFSSIFDEENAYEQYVKIADSRSNSYEDVNSESQVQNNKLSNPFTSPKLKLDKSGKKFQQIIIPSRITVDKENLYIENIELKTKIHEALDENMKFSTKIDQLEKEIADKDKEIQEMLSKSKSPLKKYVKLIGTLKKNLKNVTIELKSKEEAINALKISLKSTKMQEVRAEANQYMEECLRLRKIIDEMRLKENTTEINQKLCYQVSLIESLKKDNEKIKENLEKYMHNSRNLQESLQGPAKTLAKKKNKKIRALLEENLDIKSQLSEQTKEHQSNINTFKGEISYLKRKIEELEQEKSKLALEIKRNEFFQLFYESRFKEFKISPCNTITIKPKKKKKYNKSTQLTQKKNLTKMIMKVDKEKWRLHTTDLSDFVERETKANKYKGNSSLPPTGQKLAGNILSNAGSKKSISPQGLSESNLTDSLEVKMTKSAKYLRIFQELVSKKTIEFLEFTKSPRASNELLRNVSNPAYGQNYFRSATLRPKPQMDSYKKLMHKGTMIGPNYENTFSKLATPHAAGEKPSFLGISMESDQNFDKTTDINMSTSYHIRKSSSSDLSATFHAQNSTKVLINQDESVKIHEESLESSSITSEEEKSSLKNQLNPSNSIKNDTFSAGVPKILMKNFTIGPVKPHQSKSSSILLNKASTKIFTIRKQKTQKMKDFDIQINSDSQNASIKISEESCGTSDSEDSCIIISDNHLKSYQDNPRIWNSDIGDDRGQSKRKSELGFKDEDEKIDRFRSMC